MTSPILPRRIMSYEAAVLVDGVLTVLGALVLGIPCAVLVVEGGRGERLHSPWIEAVLSSFGITWLLLLVIWLATSHLHARRGRFAWHALVISSLAMVLAMGRPVLH